MQRTMLVLLAVLLVMLAGCLGGKGDGADGDGDGTDGGGGDGNQTEEGMGPVTQYEAASLSFQGESCAASRAYVAAGQVPLDTPADGVTRIVFAVAEDTAGQPYRVTWTFDVGFLEATTIFADGDGAVVASRTVDMPAMGNAVMDGTVPEGAVWGVLYGCGGPTQASVVYETPPGA